jgi:hypothetical protein
MEQVQEYHIVQANKYHCPIDFKVGDKVWVTTKYWKSDCSSRKLGNQMEGPFEILEQYSYSFLLKLPETIKIYPVFYTEKLRKDP